jgi:hypothetical protein
LDNNTTATAARFAAAATKRKRLGIRINQPVQEFSSNNNLALDRKIKSICDGLLPCTQRILLELKDKDKEIIADFFIDCYNNEQNVAPATKQAGLIL